jgi:hypothetical protein
MIQVPPAKLAATLTFAEKVVMPQGTIFIRELLRRKRADDPDVRIGVNKDEVKENLRTAISAGAVTMEDLEAFVATVEGWGNQHIYLYDASMVASLEIWKTAKRLRAALTGIGHGDIWENTADPTFPDELAVASASYRHGCFELLWREKDEHWWRDKSRDKPPKTFDGDLYEFRAYRQELKRSVMRFVLFPGERKAGLFVQIPLGHRHTLAVRAAQETLGGLFPFAKLRAADISNAIKVLDTRDLNVAESGKHGRMEAQNTKFEAEGATVEFDADPTVGAWKRVEAVRRVRRALQADAFQGQGGKFIVNLRLGPGLNRDVMISLHGSAARIYLQSQVTSAELWTILDQVLGASLGAAGR